MAPSLLGRPSVPVPCAPIQSRSRALEKEGSEQEQERSAGAFYESPVGAFVRFLKSNHRPTSSRRYVRVRSKYPGRLFRSMQCEVRQLREADDLESDPPPHQ